MPLSSHDLQRVVAHLADEEELKVTLKSSVYGGLVAGVSTTLGGLLGGPAGLLVGGAVGGALAYKSSGNFKPVSEVIKNMNAHDRELLYDAMKDIVDNLVFEDYLALLAFVSGGPGLLLRQQLIERTVCFLKDQLSLQLAS